MLKKISLAGALTLACSGVAPARAETVRASWYGGGEKLARHTASGDVFRPRALTAAHRTLPLGAHARVCRAHHCVIVLINDRGPAAWTGRGLDLSSGAADAIGLKAVGVAPVTIERL